MRVICTKPKAKISSKIDTDDRVFNYFKKNFAKNRLIQFVPFFLRILSLLVTININT